MVVVLLIGVQILQLLQHHLSHQLHLSLQHLLILQDHLDSIASFRYMRDWITFVTWLDLETFIAFMGCCWPSTITWGYWRSSTEAFQDLRTFVAWWLRLMDFVTFMTFIVDLCWMGRCFRNRPFHPFHPYLPFHLNLQVQLIDLVACLIQVVLIEWRVPKVWWQLNEVCFQSLHQPL